MVWPSGLWKLEIDPESQEFKCRMLNLSTYPVTLIHETLEAVASVYKKYIVVDDRDMSRNLTCIFDALEQLQYAMIVMQNSLFECRMLKRAYCKVKSFSNQEMVTSIIDNVCDLMRNT
jgi:hypothetical protein